MNALTGRWFGDGCEGVQGRDLFGVKSGKRAGRCRIAYCTEEVMESIVGGVNGGCFGHGGVFREPFNCLGNTFGARFADEGAIAMVVVCCGTKVPCVGSMWCPALALAGRIVYNNFGSEGAKGSAIKVKGTI